MRPGTSDIPAGQSEIGTSDFRHLLEGVVSADLCCSCGTCAGVCPQGIIQLHGDDCLPTITDEGKCEACGRCMRSCPGRHVPYAELLRRRPACGESSHLGPHIARFRAAAADGRLRERGASGGFVTSFLSFLLEQGEIDGVILAGADAREPWRSVGRVVTCAEDLLGCAGSRYTLVPANAVLSTAEGRCALVGLPCHVLGLRKLEQFDPSVSERIVLAVGLFCGVNLDPRATLHILHELGVTDRSQITGYCSRSSNYGSIRVALRDGRVLMYPNHDSYGFDVVRLAPLFQRARCSLCFDNVNELADVSVGDAAGEPRGQSCVVVRTSEAMGLVQSAEKASRISLSDVAPNMHRANVLKKKRRAFTLLEWTRQRRLPAVEVGFAYDLSRDYPWESDEHRDRMLLLRELARSEIGQRMFASLPRDDLSHEVGLTYVGWKG